MQATILFWSAATLVALIATVVYVIYKFRRTAQQRRQRSEARAAEMLVTLRKVASPHESSGPSSATVGVGRAQPRASAAPSKLVLARHQPLEPVKGMKQAHGE